MVVSLTGWDRSLISRADERIMECTAPLFNQHPTIVVLHRQLNPLHPDVRAQLEREVDQLACSIPAIFEASIPRINQLLTDYGYPAQTVDRTLASELRLQYLKLLDDGSAEMIFSHDAFHGLDLNLQVMPTGEVGDVWFDG